MAITDQLKNVVELVSAVQTLKAHVEDLSTQVLALAEAQERQRQEILTDLHEIKNRQRSLETDLRVVRAEAKSDAMEVVTQQAYASHQSILERVGRLSERLERISQTDVERRPERPNVASEDGQNS